MKNEYLTLADAQLICLEIFQAGDIDDVLDLSCYTQADHDALKLLSGQSYRKFVAIGLTNIDRHIANILVSGFSAIEFTQLSELNCEAAIELSKLQCSLSIEGLEEMAVDTATELAKFTIPLYVSLLGELSPEVAVELAKHRDELFVKVGIQPGMDIQRALLFSYTGHRVTLRFPCDIELTKENIHFSWLKDMEVRSFEDDSGRIWRDVIATNY